MKEGKIKLGQKVSKHSMFASIQRERVKSMGSRKSIEPSYFRVALHGAKGVGKSCIIERLVKSTFTEEHVPTVSEVYETKLCDKGKSVATLWLYDTAGSMDFPVMNRLTITKSDACVVVYSVDCQNSFEFAEQKLQEIAKIKGAHFPCVLVGNKTDKRERMISFERGLQCAVKYGASYVEMSAKCDTNVKDAFETTVKKIRHAEVIQAKMFQDKRKVVKSFSTLSKYFK